MLKCYPLIEFIRLLHKEELSHRCEQTVQANLIALVKRYAPCGPLRCWPPPAWPRPRCSWPSPSPERRCGTAAPPPPGQTGKRAAEIEHPAIFFSCHCFTQGHGGWGWGEGGVASRQFIAGSVQGQQICQLT